MGVEAFAPALIDACQDVQSEDGGVGCGVDADRRDGNAGRHLNDGIERIDPAE